MNNIYNINKPNKNTSLTRKIIGGVLEDNPIGAIAIGLNKFETIDNSNISDEEKDKLKKETIKYQTGKVIGGLAIGAGLVAIERVVPYKMIACQAGNIVAGKAIDKINNSEVFNNKIKPTIMNNVEKIDPLLDNAKDSINKVANKIKEGWGFQ